MATRTSKLKAIIPGNWGYQKVEIYFGQVRVTSCQQWVMAGELMQHIEGGSVWEFRYREGDVLRGYPVKHHR